MPYSVEKLRSLSENQIRVNLLVPLLRSMGKQDVEDYHGRNELGKDIVFWEKNDKGERENWVITLKRKDITGSVSRDLGEICAQVNQAFNEPFVDLQTGQPVSTDKVIVATAGKIPKDARRNLRAGVSADHKDRLVFWPGRKIVKYLNRYFPKLSIKDDLEATGRTFKGLNDLDLTAHILPDGSRIIEVKAKKPDIEILRINPVFPDESEEAAQFQEFLDHGTSVVIKSEHLENFEQHEELVDLFGTFTPPELHLRSKTTPPKPCILVARSSNEEHIYELQLFKVKSGRKTSTIENSHKEKPVFLRLTVSSSNKVHIELKVTLKNSGVYKTLQIFKILRALGEGASLEIRDAHSRQLLLGPYHMDIPHPPPQTAVRILENMLVIEEKLKHTFLLPEEIDINLDRDAKELRQALETGLIIQQFETGSIKITPLEGVDVLKLFPPNESRLLAFRGESSGYEICGHTFNLGPVLRSVRFVTMSGKAHRSLSRQIKRGKKALDISFTPLPECEGHEIYYLDHLNEENRSRFKTLFGDKFI